MENHKHDEQTYEPPAGCLLRIFWMLLGNALLAACAFFVLQNRSIFFGLADALYWVTVASLLAARYVDIRHFRGTTAEGEPATMVHWRRYALTIVLVSTCLWVAVHAIAYLGQ
jgi:hypothetical protein